MHINHRQTILSCSPCFSLSDAAAACRHFGSPPSPRLPVQLLESDLHETFSAGGGKGGQKVNRSNNKVNLKHIPTGLTVHCHRTRSLHDNRRIARSMLTARLDELLNGAASKAAVRVAKLQRRKAKARQRAKIKHGTTPAADQSEQSAAKVQFDTPLPSPKA